MKRKNQWVLKAYFFMILLFALQEFYQLISPDSSSFLYYFILRSFDPIFYITYMAHLTYVLLNLIHCIPLILSVYRIQFLHPDVWKYLFIFRCIFEFNGHSFEVNTAKALSHTSPELLIPIGIIAIIPYIPSYIICYKYAFGNNTHPSKSVNPA